MLHPATARWPFHLELVRHDALRIEVTLDRESFDDLAAGLTDHRKREWNRRQACAGLFGKFTQGGFGGGLVSLDLALGNHPRPGVLVAPEWPAGFDEQNFGS